MATRAGYIKRFQSFIKSSLVRQMGGAVFFSAGGAAVARLINLASSILLAHLLGHVGYGKFGVVLNTVATFQVVAGFGFSSASIKFVAETRHHDDAKAGRIMACIMLVCVITGSVAGVLLIVLAPWLAIHTMAAPELCSALRAAGGMVLFGAATNLPAGALAGLEAFRRLSYINVSTSVISFGLLAGGAYWGGVDGVVWASSLSGLATLILSTFELQRSLKHAGLRLEWARCFHEFTDIWRFSFPSFLSSLVPTPVQWVCGLLIVNQPQGFEQMGFYSVAAQWRTALMFIPTALGGASLSILSRLRHHQQESDFDRAVWLGVAINFVFVAVPVLVICLFASTIMRLYGSAFVDGKGVLIVMSLSALVHAPVTALSQAVASLNRMWLFLATNVIWGLVVLGIVAGGIQHRAMALAVGLCVAYAMQLLLLAGVLRWQGRSPSGGG